MAKASSRTDLAGMVDVINGFITEVCVPQGFVSRHAPATYYGWQIDVDVEDPNTPRGDFTRVDALPQKFVEYCATRGWKVRHSSRFVIRGTNWKFMFITNVHYPMGYPTCGFLINVMDHPEWL